VADGVIEPSSATDAVLIAAVWVNPDAGDEVAVYRNNRAATLGALRAGREGRPGVAEALAARRAPWNAFFRST
jgi:5,6,7,8-tetrahydromethanopterin hydro-lyase